METADLILYNALVLCMDDKMQQFKDGALVIKGSQILAVGPSSEIRKTYTSQQSMDCKGKVLMPGLVNAHTHIPMSLLRGLADDLRLDVWLRGYMFPVEREFVTPDFVELGSRMSCAEMIRSGITSFADMYYYEAEVAKTVAEIGMRGVCGETVIKFPTPDAKSYEDALEYTEEYIKKWRNHDLIVPAIAPHAPNTCTVDLLKRSTELALTYDVPLHIHISETSFEVDEMRKEQGMPVVPYVKKLGLLEAKVIAAHCVHIDEGEMHTLQHVHAGIAHNPSSNLKLASGIAPVKKMLEIGLNVGIGTDGPASNNDLDMFDEIRLASFIAKVSSGDPTALPAQQALVMATRMGAKALHIEHITGSLEVGKRADLILVDLDRVHNLPHFIRDPNSTYAQIVYASKSTDVTDVMVNGKWLMRDKNLLTVNEEEISQRVKDYATRIDAFLIQREQSVLSKLIAIGGATEEESFEVQAKIAIKEIPPVLKALLNKNIKIVRKRHYHEYDTYFSFKEPGQGMIRYREDHFVDEDGNITNVRNRLTQIGQTIEDEFPQQVLLSRSRYLAPANQTLRFYREYFKPDKEVDIEKDRLRYLIEYKKEEFFINVDEMLKPQKGTFLEIKSRTWSRADAVRKAKLVIEIIKVLGEDPGKTTSEDYIEMVGVSGKNL
jgi:5-methylthioadenosine/S-adenosylhomocysteine deaminase